MYHPGNRMATEIYSEEKREKDGEKREYEENWAQRLDADNALAAVASLSEKHSSWTSYKYFDDDNDEEMEDEDWWDRILFLLTEAMKR